MSEEYIEVRTLGSSSQTSDPAYAVRPQARQTTPPKSSPSYDDDDDDDYSEVSEPRGPPAWVIAVKKGLSKLQNDKSWIVIMFLLGTLDMLLNLINFIQMSDPRLKYGLVIGPPTTELWISLCVFTIVAVILYLFETVNTFSAAYNSSGDTVVAIHMELLVTLLFEHIPLATIDYFVARCRRQYTTVVESTCNIVRIIFVFMRLVWYAHIEGKKIRKNDKHVIQQKLVMACCMLFSISLAFAIMNWREEPDVRIEDYHLQNVSIFFLKGMQQPQRKSYNIPITEMLLSQGWTMHNDPFLIRSALEIYRSFPKGIDSDYDCRHNKTKPDECRNKTDKLRFRFHYSNMTTLFPYGEIVYNWARVCPRDLLDLNETVYCEEGTQPIVGDWRLFFFETKRDQVPGTKQVKINVAQPFRKTYTAPMPSYRASVRVCDDDVDLECQISTTTPPPSIRRRKKWWPTRSRPHDYSSYSYVSNDYLLDAAAAAIFE